MATDKLKLERYAVSRWTAFTWSGDSTGEEREGFLQRAARVTERELHRLCPKYQAQVEVVQVAGSRQLCFRLTLPADDAEQALERLDYYLRRMLTAKSARVPTAVNRKVSLRPPWGREEATPVG